MKKLILLFFATIVLPIFAAPYDTKEGHDCEMRFLSTEHNFGEVAESGKPVSHTFEFTNEGEHPIVITRISTTCKCTSYNFSKKPVPSGGKGKITVTFNPRKQSGVFYKVIQIFTNCEQERIMLTIRGEVK